MDQHEEDESSYEKLLSNGEPIIIYMHGNSGTRANKLRVELYKKLQNINYHVIAVDYRSINLNAFCTWVWFFFSFMYNRKYFLFSLRLCRFLRRWNQRIRLSEGCNGNVQVGSWTCERITDFRMGSLIGHWVMYLA